MPSHHRHHHPSSRRSGPVPITFARSLRVGAELAAVLAIALALPGCGGGGGGGSSAPGATFNRTTGFDSSVLCIETDAFDRTWLGGAFEAFGDRPAPGLARLDASGDVDATFAVGSGCDGTVFAIEPLVDGSGRVFVGGTFSNFDGFPSARIALVGSSGARIATFQPGTGFQGGVRALAAADDGSGDVWVGGTFSSYDQQPVQHLVRLAQDGSLVLAAPTGSFDPNDTVLALAATGDGSGDVYVGGSFAAFAGAPTRSLVRVSGTSGAPVPSFDVGTGAALAAFPAGALVTTLALAPDSSGDVLVGGSFDRYDGAVVQNLVRLRPDGSRVTTFASGGGPNAIVQALVTARDGTGDLWIAGGFGGVAGQQAPIIARLAPDGSLEPSFALGALRITGAGQAIAVAPGTSGDVHLGGTFATWSGANTRFLTRFDPDGGVDPSTPEYAGIYGTVLDVLPLDGGGVLVAGEMTLVGGVEVPNLVELAPDGALVRPFQTFVGTPTRIVRDAADPANLFATGSLFRYGTFDVNSAVRIRIADGEPVTSFGILPAPFGPNVSIADAIAVPTGGLIVNGSYSSWDGAFARNLVRLDEFGQDYGNNGFPDGIVTDYAIVDDGSGRLWAVGTFGQWASSFTPAPRVALLRPVAGFFFEPDPGFAAGSGFEGGTPRAIAVDPLTGAATIGGDFALYDGTPVGRIVRLLPDGTLDPAFVVGAGFDDNVSVVELAGDGSGDVYVHGSFTTYDGVPVPNFVRLDADGSLDTGFASTIGFNGPVTRIAPVRDGSGSIYVCGSFTTYDGVATGSVVRLDASGALD